MNWLTPKAATMLHMAMHEITDLRPMFVSLLQPFRIFSWLSVRFWQVAGTWRAFEQGRGLFGGVAESDGRLFSVTQIT
jgi:hypothetical protein